MGAVACGRCGRALRELGRGCSASGASFELAHRARASPASERTKAHRGPPGRLLLQVLCGQGEPDVVHDSAERVHERSGARPKRRDQPRRIPPVAGSWNQENVRSDAVLRL